MFVEVGIDVGACLTGRGAERGGEIVECGSGGLEDGFVVRERVVSAGFIAEVVLSRIAVACSNSSRVSIVPTLLPCECSA